MRISVVSLTAGLLAWARPRTPTFFRERNPKVKRA